MCEIQILKIIIMLIITSWTHGDTQCFGKGDGWKMIRKGFSNAWPHPCSQLVATRHCLYAIPSLKRLGMVILMDVAKTLRNPYLWQKIWQFLPAMMNWTSGFNSVHSKYTAPSTPIHPCDREPDEALVSLDVRNTWTIKNLIHLNYYQFPHVCLC